MKVLLKELQVSLCILMQNIEIVKTHKLNKHFQQRKIMETENRSNKKKIS